MNARDENFHAALSQLIDIDRDYRHDTETAEIGRQARNDAIRRALAVGHRPADIARAIGVTRARVTQIANQGS